MPTSQVGAPGWFVRIGRPRYACIESAEMGSAGNRDANSSATAVFPEAVGPNSASTKSNCMPRLWCFRSHGRADTPLVKLPRPFGGRTHLDGRPHELAAFIALGAALSATAIVGVAWAAGFGAVGERLRQVDASWLPLALAAEVLAYVGYVLAYREVARVEDGPSLPHSRALALVATGFGVFIARGGFSVDLHAFRQEFVDDREARVRVLGLGALEYALLAPATCIVAILLLLRAPADRLCAGLRAPAPHSAARGGGRRRSAPAVRSPLDRHAAGGRSYRGPRLPDRQLLAADRARRLRAPLAAGGQTGLSAKPRRREPEVLVAQACAAQELRRSSIAALELVEDSYHRLRRRPRDAAEPLQLRLRFGLDEPELVPRSQAH